MSTPVMQVRLRANFGKRCVLSDVQFDLGAGEALGMVGSSGAGQDDAGDGAAGPASMARR